MKGVRLVVAMAAAATVALASQTALALTGKELLAMCTSGDETMEFGCAMYIAGVFDATRLEDGIQQDAGKDMMCPTRKATLAEMRDEFVLYASRNQDMVDDVAVLTVTFFLAGDFTCFRSY